MIKENDLVKTLLEKDGFPAGTKGVVVSLYEDGLACEVEVWDEGDHSVDVVTFLLSEVEVEK